MSDLPLFTLVYFDNLLLYNRYTLYSLCDIFIYRFQFCFIKPTFNFSYPEFTAESWAIETCES